MSVTTGLPQSAVARDVAGAQVASADSSRLVFIDRLRLTLTVLIVAHHSGLPYGYGQMTQLWPFADATIDRSTLLEPFFAVNLAFSMGLFFLIAGYFAQQAYERKGTASFVTGRLMRLGVPLLGFIILYTPAAYLYFDPQASGHSFWSYVWFVYFGQLRLEMAHLWFIAHLLVYSVAYAGLRALFGERRGPRLAPPSSAAIVAYLLLLTLASFVVRIWYPLDVWVSLLGIRAEVGHLPQYASMFVIGIIAAKHDWVLRFPTALGRAWLAIGLAAVGLRYLYGALGAGWLPPLISLGGPDWRSLVWSAWESLICVSLGIGLLTLYRERVAGGGRLLHDLCGDAYGVYLFHLGVVFGLQVLLSQLGLQGAPLACFVIVTTLALAITFPISRLLRRLPIMQRIL